MTFYFIFIFGRRFAFVFGNDIKTFLTGTNFTVTLSVRLLVVCYEFLISSVPIIVYTLHSKLVFVSFFFLVVVVVGCAACVCVCVAAAVVATVAISPNRAGRSSG